MNPLDLAFDVIRKSVGVIPSERVDKKSQSKLNTRRKRQNVRAKREKEEGIPPLPGRNWRRVVQGPPVPGIDARNFLDPETELDEGAKIGHYSGMHQATGPKDRPHHAGPDFLARKKGDDAIYEHVGSGGNDGWQPTVAEEAPMGHMWGPTGREKITGVKRRADKKVREGAQEPFSPGPDVDMSVFAPKESEKPSAPPPPAPASRLSNWLRKPLDPLYAAYQRLRFDRPKGEEEPIMSENQKV